MKPRETSVFTRLKERVTRPTDRFERVENGLGEGWPDCNYCMVGSEGWIEIKAPHEPVRPDTPLFASNHQVSIEQINWLHNQHMAGGNGWLFIATEKRLMIIHGGRVAQLGRKVNTMTVAQLIKCAAWHVELPVKDFEKWFDLRELLILQKG